MSLPAPVPAIFEYLQHHGFSEPSAQVPLLQGPLGQLGLPDGINLLITAHDERGSYNEAQGSSQAPASFPEPDCPGCRNRRVSFLSRMYKVSD